MMRRSFKKMIAILSILTLLVCGALYFLYHDIALRNKNILVTEKDLAMLNSRQDYLTASQHYLESVHSDLDKLDKSIVAKGEEARFIEGIETLARENNLTINIGTLVTNDSDKSVVAAHATILNVKGNVKGSWQGVYLFLSEIESWPVKVKVNDFSFTSSAQENPDPKVNPVWEGSFDISVMEYK